jgi:vesicular inhibitory amino acid transporter
MAALGAAMFEPGGVSDNVVIDLQRAAPRALPPHVATWVVVVNPLTKIALTLAPVAMALEELLPLRAGGRAFGLASAGLRGGLLASVVVVALGCPFFGVVMSLIGAVFSMSISIVLPCVFFHRLCAPGAAGTAACVAIGAFGVFAGAWSTADAVRSLLSKY